MDETTKLILNYLFGLLSCGALFTFIQFLIQRHDKKKEDIKEVKQIVSEMKIELQKVKEDQSQHQAVIARTHILRFADELRNGTIHSEEYFKQQILDIDTYTRYCETHPNFSNGLTVMASEYIREEYRKNYLCTDEDENS